MEEYLELPEGFTVDESPSPPGLPKGFTLDAVQEGGAEDFESIPGLGGESIDYTQDKPERSFGDKVVGAADAALSMGTGATLGTAGHMYGASKGLLKRAFGDATPEQVMQMANDYAQSMTYEPKTEAGQEYVEEISEPLGALPPVLGGVGPAAAISGASAKSALTSPLKNMAPSKRSVKKAIIEAAPDVNEIKAKSKDLYRSIDESGARLNEDAFLNLALDVEKTAKNMGSDKDLTPKAQAVINRFESELDKPKKISDIDTLRKVAGNAAKSLEPSESAIGSAIVDKIDDFLDNLKPNDIRGDMSAGEIGKTYKKARELWSRNRKNQIMEDAVERAENHASGFENGLRNQFRSILNNKKKIRAFTDKEKSDMQRIVHGTKSGNMAKFLGKFGVSEGQATSALGAAMMATGGAAVGGIPGAIGGLALGQLSKKLSQRLTSNNAKFANAVVRAGKDGEKIAKAYIANTPKKRRSASELKHLLIERELPAETLKAMRSSNDSVIAGAALAAISAANAARLEEAELNQ